MNAQVDGWVVGGQEGERSFEVLPQRRHHQHAEGPNGIARGRRVGGVGLDQNGGAFSTQEITGEILRNVHHKLHVPAREYIMSLALAPQLPLEIKVVAVSNGKEQRPSLR